MKNSKTYGEMTATELREEFTLQSNTQAVVIVRTVRKLLAEGGINPNSDLKRLLARQLGFLDGVNELLVNAVLRESREIVEAREAR